MSVLKRNSLVRDNLIDEKVFRTDDVTTISNSKNLFNVPCVQIKNTLYTPLQASLIYQSSKIRDFLLKQKTIDVNIKNSRGENVLVTAISSKAPSTIIKELFNKNVEISIPKDSSKTSILDYADPSWEGYSELSHMVQRKRSQNTELKKVYSKKHTELKKDEETIDVDIAQKYELIKEKTIDEQKMKSEFSSNSVENKLLIQNNRNNTESSEYNVDSSTNEVLKDAPEIPSKQESTRELIDPTERKIFNPIQNLKQIGTTQIIKEGEVNGKANSDSDINISSNSTKYIEIQRNNQSNRSMEDINEEAKINNNFRKFITRVQENIRSKEFKTKNPEEPKDYTTEMHKNSEENTEASIIVNSESLTKKNSSARGKVKSRSNIIPKSKEAENEKPHVEVDNEYLLLIDHQITESIEMSKQFFTCSFCTGFRPWKSENN
ncbi:hypothetical protein RS030_213403 [Cryptosporidium xiaoi]|uniref:Uncharacterized protein n=1 Tax=Cryptosporidium xiaoi TaxID=659607 RepID=A0AAV9XX44_9CRYT